MFYFLIITVAFGSKTLLAAEKYSLADLQVLSDNNEFREFFSHAKDVLPSKRKRKWRDLVIGEAKSYVDYLRSSKNYEMNSWNEIEKISSWTQLKYDNFYQIKLNSYAKSFFENCFVSYQQNICLSKMNKFWQTSNKDSDLGYHFSKLASGLVQEELTWSFVNDIIKNQEGHYYCDKPLITDKLAQHLQVLTRTQVFSFKGKVKLQNMATAKCWKKMIPALKATMISLPASESNGIYFALNSLKQLNQKETDLWLTRYLLDKPQVGDTFNQAWNRVKELGSDFKRREAVLNSLTSLNRLPDESFSNESKAIIRHFNRYFPEYISNYAKTCLSYLEGTKIFEFGNPTPSCKNFFDQKNKKFISRNLRERFTKAKRL